MREVNSAGLIFSFYLAMIIKIDIWNGFLHIIVTFIPLIHRTAKTDLAALEEAVQTNLEASANHSILSILALEMISQLMMTTITISI